MHAQKNNPSRIFILSVAVILITAFLLSLLKGNSFLVRGGSDVSESNEDALSMYKVPKDVLNAVDEAKTSGLPVLGIRADGPSYKIPVIMYHYVENVQDKGDTTRISLNTPPQVLDSEIKTLKDAGYTFINATDLANILDGIEPSPNKPVLLTFDDGHRDFYTDAFPVLEKYGVKADIYVITNFLNRADFLTDSELSEIASSKLIEIGAHTEDHLALAGLAGSVVTNQIDGSKLALEQKLGIAITTFAYPYGSFDLAAIAIAKEAGFRTAFSTVPGTEVGNYDRFFINRLRPGGRTGQSFLNFIQNSN
jgi:peptidoglycan/xylan/chitin deacetylase (PgdA/CDA1 family)